MCHLSDETLDYRDTRSQAEINAENRKSVEDHAKEKEIIEDIRIAVEVEAETKAKFKKELQRIINSMGLDSKSRTPDYVIADYLSACYDSFSHAMDCRDIAEDTGK